MARPLGHGTNPTQRLPTVGTAGIAQRVAVTDTINQCIGCGLRVCYGFGLLIGPQQCAHRYQLGSGPRRIETIVSDFDKALGQDMHQKARNEGIYR